MRHASRLALSAVGLATACRSSKYNWKYDVDSAGSDGYFLNDYSKPPGAPEESKNYYRFIKETPAAESQVNFALPIGPLREWYDPTLKLPPELDSWTGHYQGALLRAAALGLPNIHPGRDAWPPAPYPSAGSTATSFLRRLTLRWGRIRRPASG